MAGKLLSLSLAWFFLFLVLLRGHGSGRKRPVLVVVGLGAGVVAGAALLGMVQGDLPFAVLKSMLATGFLLLFFWCLASFYRITRTMPWFPAGQKLTESASVTVAAAFLAGMVSIARIYSSAGIPVFSFAFFAAAAAASLAAAFLLEKKITPAVPVAGAALPLAVVAVLLFISSSIIRLDLFSPLAMKVMKFIHDFVHQFFESMLVPDHPFFRPEAWNVIGLLFGNQVGFWGGLIIFFLPAALMLAAVAMEPLPAVAHIRQGARRRKVLAETIRARRLRLIVPAVAVIFLTGAVYKSRNPDVEYWDPKPLPAKELPSGEIRIPLKGEVELEDGRIHKFVFQRGGSEARFFVLMTPAGKLAVTLDACAICKPEGYGQAESSVICYYCKTLIPLDTVGKPGGCNPVPVEFSVQAGEVIINSSQLLNTWNETVQVTQRVKGGGK